jgi:hypothetical protein
MIENKFSKHCSSTSRGANNKPILANASKTIVQHIETMGVNDNLTTNHLKHDL